MFATLADFAKKLPNTFTRSQVEQYVQDTSKSLERAIQLYTDAGSYFAGKRFKSSTLVDMQKRWADRVGSRSPNFVSDALARMQNAKDILSRIKQNTDKSFSLQESNQGLSFSKATVLRLVQAAEFAADYAPQLLRYVYIEETKKLDMSDKQDDYLNMTPKQLDTVVQGWLPFVSAMNVLSTRPEDVTKVLDELPDAIVNQMTFTSMSSIHGARKVDPLMMHGLRADSIPWFYPIMMVGEWQAKKLKQAEEQYTELSIRLSYFKRLNEDPNTRSAAIEAQIADLSDRVENGRVQIEQMKEKWK